MKGLGKGFKLCALIAGIIALLISLLAECGYLDCMVQQSEYYQIMGVFLLTPGNFFDFPLKWQKIIQIRLHPGRGFVIVAIVVLIWMLVPLFIFQALPIDGACRWIVETAITFVMSLALCVGKIADANNLQGTTKIKKGE